MKKHLKKILSLILVLFISLSLTACQGFFLVGDSSTDSSSSSDSSTTTTETAEELTPYEEAVSEGYRGSYETWLVEVFETEEYKSIWSELREDENFTMSLSEFIASLKGEKGDSANSIQSAATAGLRSAVTISCTASKTITETTRNHWGGTSTNSYEVSGGCSGSGVIFKEVLDEDNARTGEAYIITNYHVCFVELYYTNGSSTEEGKIADTIKVNLYGMDLSDQAIDGTFIGGSADYDIAVIKINSEAYKTSTVYKPCTLGDSDSVVSGESVIAVGNSNGEGTSVTSGIVSVPYDVISMSPVDDLSGDEEEQTFKEIRIDASVNPGNSGGGLYNAEGELIGIVNAKEVDEDTEGMGYALPINISAAVANKIIAECDGSTKTSIEKCLLGITIERTDSQPVLDAATNTLSIVSDITVNTVTESSVCLNQLQAGDVLNYVVYNNKEYTIKTLYSMEVVLLTASKNDTIEIHFIRNVDGTNTEMNVTITLTNTVAI